MTFDQMVSECVSVNSTDSPVSDGTSIDFAGIGVKGIDSHHDMNDEVGSVERMGNGTYFVIHVMKTIDALDTDSLHDMNDEVGSVERMGNGQRFAGFTNNWLQNTPCSFAHHGDQVE